MKQFLLFILPIIFTLSISGQKKLREVNLRINGIGSGTSYSAVIRKLGKPIRSETEKINASSACSNSAETHLTLFYSGLKITLLGDGKGRDLDVYSIRVTTRKWLASGIKIGANMKAVQARFGKPNSNAEQSGETTLYYVTKGNVGGVNFYFQNNKLVKVEMTETLC